MTTPDPLAALADALAERIADRVTEALRRDRAAPTGDVATAVLERVLGEAAGKAFLTIPEAGHLLAGLGRSGSYEAAKRGDLGVILEVGGRRVVPLPALVNMLTGQGQDSTRLRAVDDA